MKALQKMPGHPRLYRREATYYHRASIPVDIADTYPKSAETFSLRTKDRQEALRLVRIAAVEVDQRFAAHRASLAKRAEPKLSDLSASQLVDLKARFYRHLLSMDEEARLEGFAEGEVRAEDDCADPRPTFDEFEAATDHADALLRRLLARGEQFEPMRRLTESWMERDDIGIRLAADSPSWPKAVRALQEAWVLANADIKKRNQGDVVDTPAVKAQPVEGQTPLISSAVSEWALEKAKGAWSKKAEDDNRTWLATFIEAMGDRPLGTFTKADGRAYKAVLMRLPTNWRKLPQTRSLGILAAAEVGEKLGLPRMSVANINKAMNRVLGFWNWAIEHYDGVPNCPLTGMKVSETVSAKEKRDPLDERQLQAIFAGPLFRGAKSPRFANVRGTFCMSGTWKYWTVLLGLFTGARANEICRLKLTDINERDGFHFITIRTDASGKGVKSVAGNRLVPIHPELIRLGFLDYVKDQRNENAEHLFSGLRVDKYGYRSDALSDFFSPHLSALGIKTDRTSFHSLRHNFQDACRFAEIPKGITEAIAGREEGGTGGNYGSGEYSIRQLSEHLARISYPSVDFAKLPRYSDRSPE